MLVLYKGVHCPLCNGQHDLWMDQLGTGLTYKPHEFTCPQTQQRTLWKPDVFAHVVKEKPANALPLVPSFDTRPAHPQAPSAPNPTPPPTTPPPNTKPVPALKPTLRTVQPPLK